MSKPAESYETTRAREEYHTTLYLGAVMLEGLMRMGQGSTWSGHTAVGLAAELYKDAEAEAVKKFPKPEGA